jgi:heat shock protein 90kDa beta
MEDKENHKRIAPLLRFFSSQSNNELISLDEYVENMKPEQKDIYFIAADSLSSAKNAPFLEKLTEKEYEVCHLFWFFLYVMLVYIDTWAILSGPGTYQ